MLMWIIIISLLVIGLALIIVELIFIPGTTVVGLLGLIFSIVGIVICYNHFGNETGLYILIGSSVVTLGALFYSFRSGAWSKFSLKGSSDSRVNEGETDSLQVGDEGTTISSLRPMGKAEFGHKTYEVRSLVGYLEPGKKVRIIDLRPNQITVEPIN